MKLTSPYLRYVLLNLIQEISGHSDRIDFNYTQDLSTDEKFMPPAVVDNGQLHLVKKSIHKKTH